MSIDRLDVFGSEYFQAQVRYLSTAKQCDWNEPHALKMKGVEDIYEIRFKANRQQTRALGFFGPGSNEFTITILATHKQSVYKPASAIDTASDRRKRVLAGEASTTPLEIDGEEFPPAPE